MADIKIYVANLGKYNEGHLIGDWITLPVSEEELKELYTKIGINAEYEEIAIHDYETDVEGLKIGEYSSISKLNELAEELDGVDVETLNLIHEALGTYDIEQCLEILNNGDYILLHEVNNQKELGITWVDEIYGSLDQLGNETILQHIDVEHLGLYLKTSVEWFSNGYHDIHEDMSNEETGKFFLEEFGIDSLSMDEWKLNFDYEDYAKDNLHHFEIIGDKAISINN